MSASQRLYNEVRGILKGVGKESVMLWWIQIYGTWFLQVCSLGLVGEVGALNTIKNRTSYTAFFIPNSSPKLKKVVTVILASVA